MWTILFFLFFSLCFYLLPENPEEIGVASIAFAALGMISFVMSCRRGGWLTWIASIAALVLGYKMARKD